MGRSVQPGQYVALPEGKVYFELAGPSHGPVVVLVHGFSVPSYLWDHNFPALTQAGFRVLRFDLFGRGYSARPGSRADAQLFDRQLLGLLRALDLRSPVHLVGCSMGGAVAAQFAWRHPEWVDRLVLIDPAGTMARPGFPLSLLYVPILGDILMALAGDRLLSSGLGNDLEKPDLVAEYTARFLPQLKIRGTKRSILSTLRSGILEDTREPYRQVGSRQGPVLIIWGERDRTIPLASATWFREVMPSARFEVIAGSGHIPQYEDPLRVNPLLIDFLRKS